jgi:hypothetical protein
MNISEFRNAAINDYDAEDDDDIGSCRILNLLWDFFLSVSFLAYIFLKEN